MKDSRKMWIVMTFGDEGGDYPVGWTLLEHVALAEVVRLSALETSFQEWLAAAEEAEYTSDDDRRYTKWWNELLSSKLAEMGYPEGDCRGGRSYYRHLSVDEELE